MYSNYIEPAPQYTINVNTIGYYKGTAFIQTRNLCNNDTAIIVAEPKSGCEFVRWSDGSTNNPYTIVVTQDTSLTAEFAYISSGQYGDSLMWEYSSAQLRIMGKGVMYDYASSYEQPWSLLRDSITNIKFEEGVTSIGSYAFADCRHIDSIAIPCNIEKVGKRVFQGCIKLTSVIWNSKSCEFPLYSSTPFYDIRTQITSFVFGDSVKTIPAHLCFGMKELSSITIPNNVTKIEDYAFDACTNITSVVWNAKMCYIHTYCPFDDSKTQITSFAFGNSVESIPGNICLGVEKLSSIVIPTSVTSIGGRAFEGCTGLTSITIPNSVTSIGNRAFYDCTGLTSVTIGNSVTSIGNYAFLGCSSLTAFYVYLQMFRHKKRIFFCFVVYLLIGGIFVANGR
mgnify:CR=1 FL=1